MNFRVMNEDRIRYSIIKKTQNVSSNFFSVFSTHSLKYTMFEQQEGSKARPVGNVKSIEKTWKIMFQSWFKIIFDSRNVRGMS